MQFSQPDLTHLDAVVCEKQSLLNAEDRTESWRSAICPGKVKCSSRNRTSLTLMQWSVRSSWSNRSLWWMRMSPLDLTCRHWTSLTLIRCSARCSAPNRTALTLIRWSVRCSARNRTSLTLIRCPARCSWFNWTRKRDTRPRGLFELLGVGVASGFGRPRAACALKEFDVATFVDADPKCSCRRSNTPSSSWLVGL
jgi:hypothetical protein